MITGLLAVVVALLFTVVVLLSKSIVIVPQQSAYVTERMGQYHNTLGAGLHFLIPFVDIIAYRHSLKERAIDTPCQICITKDNVRMEVDGIVYLQVMDAHRASYGIANYEYAIVQLAQTTLRSEIGKLKLDETFEERLRINAAIVSQIDNASEAWGVKVWRYEIKDITPPPEILAKMEREVSAERDKRANILESEGFKEAEINKAEGNKQRVIKESEANKAQQINEAEGQAEAILALARANAEGIVLIAQALASQGGNKAMELKIAEKYLDEFGKLAQKSNTLVLPANLSDVGSMITLAKGLLTDDNPNKTNKAETFTNLKGF
ncbi:MAG: paraslipin [Deltaproteobacteria bacterium]|jgi:regulator of protease activity HflC (stomatin/prohibitin superfamily)|nr:paraslipin [Deltaproteobacteria bacterium]